MTTSMPDDPPRTTVNHLAVACARAIYSIRSRSQRQHYLPDREILLMLVGEYELSLSQALYLDTVVREESARYSR